MDNYDIKCRIIEEELKTFWTQWHVAKRLGGGAFGDVFEIYRDNFGIREMSALKIIQINDEAESQGMFFSTSWEASSKARDGQAVIPDVFRNEIQIMEALRGAPNVVTIEDFHLKKDSSSTMLFVRMELLNSFQQMMAERQRNQSPFTIHVVLKIGRDICTALMFCENKGIIHRDIKPANLFIDGFGNYKVGDFGASKRMDTVHMAQTMTGIGTISYMAPEVFRGRSYNNTVDIYALGLILYQLLNNFRVPFLPTEGAYTTQDIDSANYQRMQGVPLPSLAGKIIDGERIDSRLDAVVRKACAMNPADRFQTAKEFYDVLALLEKVLPETAGKKSTPGYIKKAKGSPAPAASLQNREQERAWPEKKKYLGRNKPLISTVFLLILLVAALYILQRGGVLPKSSTRTDSDVAMHSNVEKGSDSEENDTVQENTALKDESIARTNSDVDAQSEVEKGSDSAEENTVEKNNALKEESAEIVEIPDPVLKKAIQDTLVIGDREITEMYALALTHLDCLGEGENQVKSITGLSAFKNLNSLALMSNQINDISELSELTKLTVLGLNDNQISDISVLSGLTNLKSLFLDSNQVSDISALSGLKNLTELDLYDNQVSDISALSDLTNLTYLELGHNQIDDISVLSGMINMTRLNLSSNKFSDISALSGLRNLMYLNLSSNKLSDISALSGLKDLRHLDLSSNKLNDISALSGLTNLNILELSGNPVLENKTREEIMEVLSGAENLTNIDF